MSYDGFTRRSGTALKVRCGIPGEEITLVLPGPGAKGEVTLKETSSAEVGGVEQHGAL